MSSIHPKKIHAKIPTYKINRAYPSSQIARSGFFGSLGVNNFLLCSVRADLSTRKDVIKWGTKLQFPSLVPNGTCPLLIVKFLMI